MSKKAEPKEYSIHKPYVHKMLDISTGHITEKDAMFLRAVDPTSADAPIVKLYEEGFIVTVSMDKASLDSDLKAWGKVYSTQFCKIINLAHAQGCAYVQFDEDGMIYKDLKLFNW